MQRARDGDLKVGEVVVVEPGSGRGGEECEDGVAKGVDMMVSESSITFRGCGGTPYIHKVLVRAGGEQRADYLDFS